MDTKDRASASGTGLAGAYGHPSPDGLGPAGGIPDARKAYAVLEEYENTGSVIYASSAVAARRIGANEHADGDFSAVSCKRAPWADKYRDEGLPISVMVENGWHFDCMSCGRRIDSDYLWETDRLPEDIVGHQYSSAYCDAVCEAREMLARAEREKLQTRWLRRFAKIVKRRFPNAHPIHRHAHASRRPDGTLRIEQVTVEFDFPGRQYGMAQLRWDRNSSWKNESRKPYWSCSGGDREAFEAYAAIGMAPTGGDAKAAPVPQDRHARAGGIAQSTSAPPQGDHP